ncbi:MAG: zinc ABC transporter substrate-binding protein [Thermodesulfobacteriota bacterium]|nr:zinc ABC transporter substrate-binding protein [Thermodesulfobacteriota bacterium]
MWLFRILWISAFFAAWAPMAGGISSDRQPVIAASTTMIASLLQDIGGKEFQILTILPPASCPGHFDLKPNDLRLLRRAELIICHPFQQAMQKVLKQHLPAEDRWLILPEEKSLTVPDQYIKTGLYLLQNLRDRFPEKASYLNHHWTQREDEIQRLKMAIQGTFGVKGVSSFPVIVSVRQKEFVEFWGFPVIGRFDDPEGTSMPKLGELIQNGRRAKVRAIIGNLQSGDRQAFLLSEKIGAPLVMLSNFPGGEPGTVSYLELLQANCSRLLGMIK